jgi:hypothetical protein
MLVMRMAVFPHAACADLLIFATACAGFGQTKTAHFRSQNE